MNPWLAIVLALGLLLFWRFALLGLAVLLLAGCLIGLTKIARTVLLFATKVSVLRSPSGAASYSANGEALDCGACRCSRCGAATQRAPADENTTGGRTSA